MADNIDRFGFTMCDVGTDEIITEQKGVFRTNCLDWYVSFRPHSRYGTIEPDAPAWIARTLYRTSCPERAWSSISSLFGGSG